MPENKAADPTFDGLLRKVPVGELYEESTIDGRTVRKGDIAAHNDRDIDHRDADRGVHSRLFVGVVEGILDPEYQDEPQIFSTMPAGKLDASDVHVSGEGSLIPKETGMQKFVEQFLNSEYEKYMVMEWGEDIDGDGEDFKRRGK